MTRWICIGVYIVGAAATPGILSFVDGKPWSARGQSTGDDIGVFISMLLWPVFAVLWIIHAWSRWMSDAGVGLHRWFKELLTDD